MSLPHGIISHVIQVHRLHGGRVSSVREPEAIATSVIHQPEIQNRRKKGH
jgi:hypothetical protein